MNKSELVNAVATKTGASKKATEASVNAIVDTISAELKKKRKRIENQKLKKDYNDFC